MYPACASRQHQPIYPTTIQQANRQALATVKRTRNYLTVVIMLFRCNLSVLLVFFLPFFTLCHPSPNYKPTWTPLANITPFGRQQHSTVFLPPCTVAILGGFISINDSVLTTDHVQFYFITGNTWTTKAALPRPLSHVNGAVVDGKVYVLGGLIDGPQGQQLWRAVPDSWVYEPSRNLWSPLPPMPMGEERGKAAVGVHNSRIYLAGGDHRTCSHS
jgi:hypothetical protein